MLDRLVFAVDPVLLPVKKEAAEPWECLTLSMTKSLELGWLQKGVYYSRVELEISEEILTYEINDT